MDFKKFYLGLLQQLAIIGVYGWVKGINNAAVTYRQDIKRNPGVMCTTKRKETT
jgi:LemA protein